MRPHKIALVVDPEFGGHLDALARRRHVWIVGSPTNRQAVLRVWGLLTDNDSHHLESGATEFDPKGSTPSEWCLNILETVEDHHGRYSHDPALSILEVIGVGLTEELRSEFAAWGYSRFSEDSGSFVAYRQAQAAE